MGTDGKGGSQARAGTGSRAIDNLYIEKLWRTVKYDYVYLSPFENGWALYQGLKVFFRVFLNQLSASMRKILPFLVLLLPLAMASCAKTETKTLSTTQIELLEEYPMEGANTVTGIWKVNLGDIDASKIEEVRLTNIRFTTVSPATTDAIEGVTVQLAASGAAMQKVAVMNPVSPGVSTFSPGVAGEQENLAPLLNQKEVTLVADVNLKKELEGALQLKATMEFEIKVNQ